MPRLLWRILPTAALAVAVVLVTASTPGDLPPPIRVQIEESSRLLPPGTTLAEAADQLRLRPKDGDLVDVDGVPLVRDRYHGHVEVNGQPAGGAHGLVDGDVVLVVDAQDRTEPLHVDVVPVPGGQVSNPQSHLGTTPGEQVITSGRISGKLVSIAFRATGPTDSPPAVALTFDDGPSPVYTSRILQVLRRFDVKATFFMLGYLADRYPDLARKVAAAGHAVGNHTMNHPQSKPFARLPLHQMEGQIEEGHRTLVKLGIDPVAFRPPGGSWDEEVLTAAEELGERTVLWSIDTEDWRGLKPKAIARTVLQEARPGSIILLHDGGGNRSATVKALPKIIKGLEKEGLRFETL
jgi:peptidoglycan/xylan/chitin deacetylase (PgdA/CDA1 family)/sulfur carrier protein ThiS